MFLVIIEDWDWSNDQLLWLRLKNHALRYLVVIIFSEKELVLTKRKKLDAWNMKEMVEKLVTEEVIIPNYDQKVLREIRNNGK